MPGYFDPAYFDADYFDAGSSSATADAVISRNASGSLTSSAVLSAGLGATLAADSVVSGTGSRYGSFTASGDVLRGVGSSLASASVIMSSRTGSLAGSSWAVRRTTGSLSASAVVRSQRAASATSDASVSAGSSYGLIFVDLFERTVSHGLGGDWALEVAKYANGTPYTPALSRVDGHKALLTTYKADGTYTGYETGGDSFYERYSGMPSLVAGIVQFDFYTGPISNSGSWYQFSTSDDQFQIRNYNGQYWDIYCKGMDAYTPGVVLDLSSWYTVKVECNAWTDVPWGIGGHYRGGLPNRYKIWKRGTTEPGWTEMAAKFGYNSFLDNTPGNLELFGSYFINWAIDEVGPPVVAHIVSEYGTTLGVDNLYVYGVVPAILGQFTADTIIKHGPVRADATLRKTQSGSLASDAWLKRVVIASTTADAVEMATTTSSFTANYALSADGSQVVGVPTRITVGGVDITEHVVFETAEFTARVNGAVGECTVEVLDRDHSLTFRFGQEILFYIDGIVRWGGWLMQPRRTFPFPVSTVDRPRIWTLRGVDWNVLFDRRIVHDSSHPAKKWTFPAGTSDATILNEALDYADIDGFTRDVSHVAAGILDIPGSTAKYGGEAMAGGYTLRDVFAGVSRNTAGIYYITPDKVITYCDSDRVTSQYVLTDSPGSSAVLAVLSSDGFGRVVPQGMGSAYEWSDYDSRSGDASLSNVSVDGSSVVLPSAPDAHPLAYGSNYESYLIPGTPASGAVRLDFWVPPLDGQASGHPSVGIVMNGNASAYATAGDAGSWTVNGVAFSPDPSSWWTMELLYDAAGCEVRAWPRGGTRPDSPAMQGVASVSSPPPAPLIDLYYSAMGGHEARIDNLTVLQQVPIGLQVGYREFRLADDSTDMVNDAMVWGVGYGSQKPVFSRERDQTSIDEHGLWQAGNYTTGVFRQATADALASSVVYGSPEAHRGSKDPKHLAEMVAFQPVFGAGDVVVVESAAFGTIDVLPVREMRVTWPVPKHPRIALRLSWEPDAAWQMTDPYTPKTPGGGGCTDCNPPGDPQPGGCDGCGITDTFTRTVSGGWGTNEAGLTWAVDGWDGVFGWGPPPDFSVSGTLGMVTNATGQFSHGWADIATGIGEDVSALFRFSVDHVPTGSSPDIDTMFYSQWESGGSYRAVNIAVSSGATGSVWIPGGTTTAYKSDWTNGWYWCRVLQDPATGTISAKVWPYDTPEPSTWLVSETLAPVAATSFTLGVKDATHGQIAFFDDLSITGLDKCSAPQFDDFNRTVASGWGTSTPGGYGWVSEAGSISVDGSSGVIQPGGIVHVSGGPWASANPFTMTARLTISPGPFAVGQTSLWFADEGFSSSYEVALSTFSGSVIAMFCNEWQNGSLMGDGNASISIGSGSPIMLKVYSDVSGFKAKAWPESSPEPASWSVELAVARNDTLSSPSLRMRLASANTTTSFDYIDFLYPGMPCYIECGSPSVYDDFERSVSNGWGTASSGAAWTLIGWQGASGTDVSSGFNVIGGKGVIDARPFTGSLLGQASLPSGTSVPFTCSTSVTFPTDHFTDMALVLYKDGSGAEVDVYLNIEGGTGSGWVQSSFAYVLDGKGGYASNSDNITLVANADMTRPVNFKFLVQPSSVMYKAWQDVEPDWQVVLGVGATSGSSGVDFLIDAMDMFRIGGAGTINGHGLGPIAFDYISFGPGCAGVPERAGTGTEDSHGVRVTESLEPQGAASGGYYASGTKWASTYAYAAGSCVLYVDGRLFRSFTEWDPSGALVQTTAPVASGSDVTMSYLTNGRPA